MLRVVAFALLVSSLGLAQQESTRSSGAGQSVSPVQQQPSTTPQQSHRPPQTPQAEAWQILETACASGKATDRATAVGVLGLLPGNVRARGMAEKALRDEKPEVRSSAAAALAEMRSKASIVKLRKAVDDEDPSVALAAAHALIALHDDSGYDVYYEVLTGQRRSSKGLIASQTGMLKDPRKVAELGVQEGIGFVPFVGMGWRAFRTIHKDDATPVRAAAARVLSKDPDPNTTDALRDAAGDRNGSVRTAALEALAERGDPSALSAVVMYMSDEKDGVKYTAAAAVLRLSAIKKGHPATRREKKLRSADANAAEIRDGSNQAHVD